MNRKVAASSDSPLRCGVVQPSPLANARAAYRRVQRRARARGERDDVHPELLLKAAAPVLKALAAEQGYSRLAVFGSVATHRAQPDSDIDLIVEAPAGTSSFDFIRFKQLIEQVLGREIDLIDYDGLKPRLDDDIRREAVLL